ncbi:DUF1569 domain-containing protein [Segetibacter aerophilus]|uniref:DUF1569 domain-containing protein n=1 Tax=Segetibacter aerophilus TaxID=670293 RepID=A0A512BHI9_9BACT|nr:DUF1569 domain-containing protein [Segetibacter aerophilus]GEO11418.1 hypothetical protein SAE01_39140 [Segetibacter aerophilus]
MKNLFQPEALEEIKQRMQKLQPNTERLWGKMEVAQMLAHCSAAMEVAVGDKHPPRIFIGRLIGPFIKSVFTNEKPLRKSTPTDKSFLVIDQRNFEKEKSRLLELVERFSKGGPQKVTTHPHSSFGKLTPVEWSTGMYKHLDHHLRQFGV